MDELKIWILALAGIPGFLIILIGGIARLRDDLYKNGWIDEKTPLLGYLARASRRAQLVAARDALTAMGFDEEQLAIARKAVEISRFRPNHGPRRLSVRLLEALKPCTHKLEEGFAFASDQHFYIDTMGAMHYSPHDSAEFTAILAQWISLLVEKKVIEPPDVILANKDGNVILVKEVCSSTRTGEPLPAFICKGVNDHSRVMPRVGGAPHHSDFEGLAAYLQQRSDSKTKYRVLAVDDNCTSGAGLCSAMKRFNEYVRANNVPFEEVADAVVLFVRKSLNTEETFHNRNFRLHALLSLGDKEMEEVANLPRRRKGAWYAMFKDGFGCEKSKELDA